MLHDRVFKVPTPPMGFDNRAGAAAQARLPGGPGAGPRRLAAASTELPPARQRRATPTKAARLRRPLTALASGGRHHGTMSHLTELLVSTGPDDAGNLEHLSFWIRDHAPRSDSRIDGSAGHLVPLAGPLSGDAWAGRKQPISDLWAGVLDFVDIDGVLDHIRNVAWSEPDAVQVLVRDEDDPWYRLYMLRDRHLHQLALAPEPGATGW